MEIIVQSNVLISYVEETEAEAALAKRHMRELDV